MQVRHPICCPAALLSSGSTQFISGSLASIGTLAAGDAYIAPELDLLTNQVGTFTESITLSPTDQNDSGANAALNSVTLEVVGTIDAPPLPPPPPVPEANVWGDVHITTFDGVYYNFDAAGEYVLTRSTVGGDTFQVQARLQPPTGNGSVSEQTEVGAAVGSDDIVFAVDAGAPFYQNGTAETIGIGNTLALSGGSVTQTSGNTYRVNWNTGESMSVTLNGSIISESIVLTAADAGNVQGLLGPDDGNPSTDLQLPNGQPIASGGTISSSTLYGQYANDWQVTSQADSLLYYAAGQNPFTFVIPGFPDNALDTEPVADEPRRDGNGHRRGRGHHRYQPGQCGSARSVGHRQPEFSIPEPERATSRRGAEQCQHQQPDATAERRHHGQRHVGAGVDHRNDCGQLYRLSDRG